MRNNKRRDVATKAVSKFRGWRRKKLEEKLSWVAFEVSRLNKKQDSGVIVGHSNRIREFLLSGKTSFEEITESANAIRSFLNDSKALVRELKTITRWFKRSLSKDDAHTRLVLSLTGWYASLENDLNALNKRQRFLAKIK